MVKITALIIIFLLIINLIGLLIVINSKKQNKFVFFIRKLYWKNTKNKLINYLKSKNTIVTYSLIIQLELSSVYKDTFIKKGLKSLHNLMDKEIQEFYLKLTSINKNNTIQESIDYMRAYAKKENKLSDESIQFMKDCMEDKIK